MTVVQITVKVACREEDRYAVTMALHAAVEPLRTILTRAEMETEWPWQTVTDQ